MLGRSLNKLERQDFGYRVDGRVVVSLNRLPATYTQPQLSALYRQIEERLNRLPGVEGSGLALYNPLTDNWGELIFVAGHPQPKLSEQAGASWDRVSANYLQKFGIPVLRGRAFSDADNETSAPVAIVNEAFVRAYTSRRDPIGLNVRMYCPQCDPYRIVGVVRDTRHRSLDRPASPEIYVPYTQMPHGELTIVVRGTDDPMRIATAMRQELNKLDPNLALSDIATLDDVVMRSVDERRFNTQLLAAFSACALLLAAVGLYGSAASWQSASPSAHRAETCGVSCFARPRCPSRSASAPACSAPPSRARACAR
jgi:hypothetical protein